MQKVVTVLTFLAFFASYSLCQGQVNKKVRDSLAILLHRHQIKDTQRISLLNKYARVSRHDNSDTAMLLTEEALLIANKLHSTLWRGQLLATKSMIFSRKSQYDSSIEYGMQAATMLKNEKLYSEYAGILNTIAENYSSLGEFSRAMDIFHEVINVARLEKNKADYAIAYGDIGTIYFNFELYNKAIENFEKSFRLVEQMGDSLLMAGLLSNLGVSCLGLKENVKAEGYLRRSVDILSRLGRTDALPNFKAALALSLSRQGKTGEAMSLLGDALGVIEKTGKVYDRTNALIVLATTKKIIGDSTKNRTIYHQALQYANIALDGSIQLGDTWLRSHALDEISQLYMRLHQPEKAYQVREQYISLRDSIIGENRRQEIALKESEFNNANTQALLISKHESEMAKQKSIRNLIAASGIFLLLLAIIAFLFYKRFQENKTLQVAAELKAEMTDLEMKALRAQMNPHFIFNCLNSIADYISKNKGKEARDYLAKFARLMRMILEHSEQKKISLAKDLHALEIYMELESLRFERRPEYHITVDKKVDIQNTYVPSMILQPFVENCFKHGIQQLHERGRITIQISDAGRKLHCVIEDNGTGDNTVKDGQHNASYGLAITTSRLHALHKSGNSEASATITHLSNGTRVELFIPC